MFRNMVTSLFKYDRIRTTDVKAKELRRWADHLIGLAKRGDLHARRQALAIIREKQVVHKLFEEADKRFGKVNSGYTRIVKLGYRQGDAAPLSVIELITPDAAKPKKRKKKPATEAAPAAAELQAATKTAPVDAVDDEAEKQSEGAETVETAPDTIGEEDTVEASEAQAKAADEDANGTAKAADADDKAAADETTAQEEKDK
jgi:large subunit ribosomal protein L17